MDQLGRHAVEETFDVERENVSVILRVKEPNRGLFAGYAFEIGSAYTNESVTNRT